MTVLKQNKRYVVASNRHWPEGIAVALYYFDVPNGPDSMRDNEGAEFHSLDAAVHAATRSAAEICSQRFSADACFSLANHVRLPWRKEVGWQKWLEDDQ
jgi:hypothetical protein